MSSVFVPHTQARSPNPTDQSGEAPEAQAPRQSEGVSQKGLPCLWVARQREMLCSPLTLSIHPPPATMPSEPSGDWEASGYRKQPHTLHPVSGDAEASCSLGSSLYSPAQRS